MPVIWRGDANLVGKLKRGLFYKKIVIQTWAYIRIVHALRVCTTHKRLVLCRTSILAYSQMYI
jgi:hypothetical protein